MISENSLRQISDIFAEIPQDSTHINPDPNLFHFIIATLMLQTDMVKDFPPDGHMSIISFRICSTLTASILFLILFLEKIT